MTLQFLVVAFVALLVATFAANYGGSPRTEGWKLFALVFTLVGGACFIMGIATGVAALFDKFLKQRRPKQ